MSGLELREVVINGYFTVRLTVSVDPPPPLRSAFWDFFCVLLTLYYHYVCSETDFTQEKGVFLDDHLQEASPSDYHLQEAGPSK